jgi:hypothetical protein
MTPKRGRAGLAVAAFAAILLGRVSGAQAGIGVTHTSNLGFGQIVATPVSGSVTGTPAGFRSSSGGVLLGNGSGASVASVTVTGAPDRSYSITLPSSAALVAGSRSMTADTFTSSPNGSGRLGAGGTQQVTVGATLHVAASQPAASYSGVYAVTVSYE